MVFIAARRCNMLFSFIVPTYNEEKYIEKCLQSIRNQNTKHNYEIIVVDAKSSDKTVKIARKYADKIIHSKIGSVSTQRNMGAHAAKGKYLAFIDADTQLYPNYLEAALNYMLNEYSAVSFGFKFDKKTPAIIMLQILANRFYHFKHILPGFNVVIPNGVFFKIGEFKNIVIEDVDISERLRLVGKTEYVLNTLTITSARKQEKMGVLETIKYYAELDIVRRKYLSKYNKLLKYNEYVHIR